MVRLLSPETRAHRAVMKLRFGAAADLSVDLLRKALSRENRSNSTFMGVRWLQILESKYFNFHFDFAECQNTKISAK